MYHQNYQFTDSFEENNFYDDFLLTLLKNKK